jgi:rod shape-determining protein MreC
MDRENAYTKNEFYSLTFIIFFSLGSLVWKGNLLSKGISKFHVVGDFFSESINSFGSIIKSPIQWFESHDKIKRERDACYTKLEEIQTLPDDLEKLRKENQELRALLQFTPQYNYPSVSAEVISVRLNAIYRTIIINKGSESGIRAYMPVVARTLDENGKYIDALVGKTIAVTDGSSVVQPLINSNFSMGVSMPGTNLWASLSGNSGRVGEAELDYIDAGIIIDPRAFGRMTMGPNTPYGPNSLVNESFSKIGKPVYTSGGSGVFFSGIPVGIITEEGERTGSFKTAYLKPYIQFDKLQYLRVILKKPDKWIEKWPEEKVVNIDSPYFGELNYPSEESESGQDFDRTNPKKPTTPPSPPPILNSKTKPSIVTKPREPSRSQEESDDN